MFKVIINGNIIKEFNNLDDASEYYAENFKNANRIIMLADDEGAKKILAKKDN